MLNHDDQTKFIEILQDNISRMANNSANCKNWCMGILTGICALLIEKDELFLQKCASCDNNVKYFLIVPIAMFFILDSYYLSIERNMRRIYNKYVDEIAHSKDEESSLTYRFTMDSWIGRGLNTFKCFFSTSTWPFYLTLAFLLFFFLNKFCK